MLNFSMASEFAFAEKLLVRRNALKAYLIECGLTSLVEIKAEGPQYFNSNADDLKYLTKRLGLVLSVNGGCSKADVINLRGTVDSKLYFAGTVKKRDQWNLVGLYLAPK